jgi:hypothetical protein
MKFLGLSLSELLFFFMFLVILFAVGTYIKAHVYSSAGIRPVSVNFF